MTYREKMEKFLLDLHEDSFVAMKYFIENKNNIGCISQNFKEHFGDMDVKIPKKLKLETKKLERNMLDKEILEEFKPQESTLGELAYALENIFNKRDWYIMYIRDKDDVLWAVYAGWYAGGRGWVVFAFSVTGPRRWSAGSRVVSRKFGSGTLGNLDLGQNSDLEKRVLSLERDIEKLREVIKF